MMILGAISLGIAHQWLYGLVVYTKFRQRHMTARVCVFSPCRSICPFVHLFVCLAHHAKSGLVGICYDRPNTVTCSRSCSLSLNRFCHFFPFQSVAHLKLQVAKQTGNTSGKTFLWRNHHLRSSLAKILVSIQQNEDSWTNYKETKLIRVHAKCYIRHSGKNCETSEIYDRVLV